MCSLRLPTPDTLPIGYGYVSTVRRRIVWPTRRFLCLNVFFRSNCILLQRSVTSVWKILTRPRLSLSNSVTSTYILTNNIIYNNTDISYIGYIQFVYHILKTQTPLLNKYLSTSLEPFFVLRIELVLKFYWPKLRLVFIHFQKNVLFIQAQNSLKCRPN